MTELLFYHLQRAPLERVLPGLLEKSLQRGWRCAVQGLPERLLTLDDALWTYKDESFLPHGLESDEGERQPIVLVAHEGNPNGATVRFLVDGVPLPSDAALYERIVLLFDGNDAEAVEGAREHWRQAKSLGFAATYWQQSEDGRWEKKA
ncbi:DNA polymerase III subunit chi [Labrys monachus]|uniref:DNA polymerase-3 subunit chi n=1 Tax=Labrys monachus TaxID=217067 RepID=A0ABU0FHY9_9HYPH|nr:DNA polymerase III subunit chi [Labrys monachus]MDQ0394226.1 DNA polymerase-3 subunit chi [Labrys monachus]